MTTILTSHRMVKSFKTFAVLLGALSIGACTTVGPDYERPDSPLPPNWYQDELAAFDVSPEARVRWWQALEDPVLDRLIERAQAQNDSLKIAALRVLESRAQLGIAAGSLYPQTQVAVGSATIAQGSESAANTAAGDLKFTDYLIGVSASWEPDFWGRYARGIEAADASYLASVAAYDQALILVIAQVADIYTVMRTVEEQIRITRENIERQERSVEITEVQFRNGTSSELDLLQARTLLLSTKSTLPTFASALARAQHALSVLLGMAPGDLTDLLEGGGEIPVLPDSIAVGVPADLLRARPDVRRAEFTAMAQSAAVGLAEANLYPSFSLGGFVGLQAAGNTSSTRTGEDGIGELFSTDSLTYSFGPSFVWPFLNYDRIENAVRVQDARLQQALLAYRDTVLRAAREVEDAIVDLHNLRQRDEILAQSVNAARRSAGLAMLRFKEGLADYQRVLSAEQALFSQQSRYVQNRGDVVRSAIALYLALGGGWQIRLESPLLDEDTKRQMQERTDWGDLMDTAENNLE